MKTIAILGLGEMGKRMANNYIDAGFHVQIWNRSSTNIDFLLEKGAKIFTTPKECVSHVDVAISMLRDDIASKEVWLDPNNGAIHSLPQNSISIECSTLSYKWSHQLHQHFKTKNHSLLDAPVLGSLPQAEAKQLIHLVGGNTSVLKRVEKLLSANATAIHHVGTEGNGHGLKLIANGIFGMQVTALCETLSLLKTLNINKKEAINILNQLPITSPALQGIGLSINNKHYNPLFPINLVEKDFKYLSELIEEKSQNHSIIKLNHQIYTKAKKNGYGNDHISGIAQLYQI